MVAAVAIKQAEREDEVTQSAGDIADEALAVLSDLEQRLSEATAAVGAFKARRAPYAFAAAQGDAGAKAALAALTVEEEAAKHSASDLQEAVEEARRLAEEAALEARSEYDAARLAAAQALGREYIAEAEKIDRLLGELRAAVDRRAKLGARLIDSGCLRQIHALGSRPTNDDKLNSAFRYWDCHGLYFGNPEASRRGDQPLATAARQMVEHLELPADLEAKQVLWG